MTAELPMTYAQFQRGGGYAASTPNEKRACKWAQNRTVWHRLHSSFRLRHSCICQGQIHKILQQLQADLLAFFRMKLRGINIVAPDGGREAVAVFGARGDDARIHRLRIKAVDEIDIAAAGNAAIQWAVWPRDFELVPADLRNF